jgi:cytochrome bd-type quinol oxidase subunit 2
MDQIIRRKIKQGLVKSLSVLIVFCWMSALQAAECSTPKHSDSVVGHRSSAVSQHPEHGNEHDPHAAQTSSTRSGHGAEHETADAHGNGHHVQPPFIYYLSWGLLGFTFIIVCSYCLWVFKRGKPKHEGLTLAVFLVLLAIALYALNQFPELQRHFDPASHQFVDGYHESATFGFVKFIYKVALGILLMIYALIGMEHH